MSDYNYVKLFNPTIFKLKLGYRDYDFYLIEPQNITKSNFLELLSYLETLIYKNCIVLLDYNKLIDAYFKVKKNVSVTPKSFEQSLADSVTKCMVVRLSNEVLKKIVPKKIESVNTLVIASKGIVTYICSKIDVNLNAIPHGVSLDTSIDYYQFNNLWYPLNEQNKSIDRIGGGIFYFSNIGKMMGWFHKRNILHGDACLNNFLFDCKTGDANVVDLEDSMRVFLRDLRSDECAYDLRVLLSEILPNEWQWIKIGYLSEFDDRAAYVINLIEKGKEYRWLVDFNRGDYDMALKKLIPEYQKLKDDDFDNEDMDQDDNNFKTKASEWLLMLNSIGVCYAKSHNYKEAIKYYLQGKEIVDKVGSEFDIFCLYYNLSKAFYDSRNYEKCVSLCQVLLNLKITSMKNYISAKCQILYLLIQSMKKTDIKNNTLEYINELILLNESLKQPIWKKSELENLKK